MTQTHPGMNNDFDPEFDHVFTVQENLQVTDAPDVYAPSVHHSETDDVEIDTPGWTPLTGWTGQWGYHGAVMHPSEQFAGGIRDHVLSTPGTYVLVVVEVWDSADEPDPEPAGWAVLRK